VSLGAPDKLELCSGVFHFLDIDRIADVSPTMANEDADSGLTPAHLNITMEADSRVVSIFLV